MKKNKKKTNSAYLMLCHHQILENDRLPMERERERERERDQYKEKNTKKKTKRQLVIVDWKTKRL